jgi:nicotinamide phosphoribosyltransferase
MNSILLTDGYKLSHHQQYPEGTSLVFSNFTPRSDSHAPEGAKGGVVVFGTQMMLQMIHEHFAKNFFKTEERIIYSDEPRRLLALKKKVLTDIKTELDFYLGGDYDVTHFANLWDLGYLPIEVRALGEGTICPIRVPMLTIHNTHEDFYWLPNFLETIISNLLWKPITSATLARAYKSTLSNWAFLTDINNLEFVNWQGHDFSMRGLDSVDATISSGMGHLTSFSGTDSLPAVYGTRKYYDAEGFVAGSVPATEHSVMCAGSKEDELETYRRLLKIYPTGIVSVVSDTWDLWNVITNILPQLKEEILARDGKLVIRPDSGDPVEILCGTSVVFSKDLTQENVFAFSQGRMQHRYFHKEGTYYVIENVTEVDCTWKAIERTPELVGVVELLYDIFGGTINEQGYKVLDSHIGAIYGDSITLERANKICQRLSLKGFASTNVVLGIGSFTYQYNTRDTYGMAMKATYVEIEENFYASPESLEPGIRTKGREIFKDPVTDNGMKKSAKGLLKVIEEKGKFTLKDGITWDELEAEDNLLKIRYKDGEFFNTTTFEEIRERLK